MESRCFRLLIVSPGQRLNSTHKKSDNASKIQTNNICNKEELRSYCISVHPSYQKQTACRKRRKQGKHNDNSDY